MNDTRAVIAEADSLERFRRDPDRHRALVAATLAHNFRARAAFASNDMSRALLHLEQADSPVIEAAFEAEAADRNLRAVVLDSLGRDVEARPWYRAIARARPTSWSTLLPHAFVRRSLRASLMICSPPARRSPPPSDSGRTRHPGPDWRWQKPRVD